MFNYKLSKRKRLLQPNGKKFFKEIQRVNLKDLEDEVKKTRL